MSQRLSAMDISALASMKNVAKCDTWCELQNPVNHRVFERKLSPKPLGRGHVCLGISHCVAPLPLLVSRRRGRKMASRALSCAAGPNTIPRRCTSRPVVVETSTRVLLCETASSDRHHQRPIGALIASTHARCFRPRPQVRRDYPLSLSISISGGKETYKDSPSNGERTENSPT
ncbi:hypothetical protein CDL12_15068 [Handroanthus impetiginosus]|uniref:Uncharacterized protein n=1 Tax=Handroanthus impetiginosus TaxID=429701 RepID=A0A2G9H486_9LAMI|nr:hypothetical protein CDL12_15068 [Handroanthus impetiginosus]